MGKEAEVCNLERDDRGTYKPQINGRSVPSGLFKIRLVSLILTTFVWLHFNPSSGTAWWPLLFLVIIAIVPLVRFKIRSPFAIYGCKMFEGVIAVALMFALGQGRFESLLAFVVLLASPVDDVLFSLPLYIVLQVGAWIIIPAKTAWNTGWEDGMLLFDLKQSFLDACVYPRDYIQSLQEGRMREFLARRAAQSAKRYLLPSKRTDFRPPDEG